LSRIIIPPKEEMNIEISWRVSWERMNKGQRRGSWRSCFQKLGIRSHQWGERNWVIRVCQICCINKNQNGNSQCQKWNSKRNSNELWWTDNWRKEPR